MAKQGKNMDVLNCLALLELDDMDSDDRGTLDEMRYEIHRNMYGAGFYNPWGDSDSDCESQPRRNKSPEMEREEKGKDGTVWITQPVDNTTGRLSTQNDTTVDSGPTPYAKDRIYRALDSFHCLCDMEMLQRIRDSTVAEARVQGDTTWDLSVDELEAFIALLYVRGIYGKHKTHLASFWSDKSGLDFFRDTMPRTRFTEIMRYLRFDTSETRLIETNSDKFTPVSDVWNAFVQNCIVSYKPGVNITVEEQWFPTKAKCDIKFCLVADVDSKYVLNVFPFLEKDESQPTENMVMKLVEPYLDTGRNVTTNDLFTSLKLANMLIANKTNLVGLVSKAGRELPPSVRKEAHPEPFPATTVLKHDQTTLTVYKVGSRKNVCILSTMHPTVSLGNWCREPETVTHYNSSKVGVDTIARKYTVKGGLHCWPVAVFYNMLDLAAINAHVLFTQCTGKTVSRRDFIMDLASDLRENHMRAKDAAKTAPLLSPIQHTVCEKKTQCQVRRSARNKARESFT